MIPTTNQLLQSAQLLEHFAAACDAAAAIPGTGDKMAELHQGAAAAYRASSGLLGALAEIPPVSLAAEAGALARRLRRQASEGRATAERTADGWTARMLVGTAEVALADAATVESLIARLLLAEAARAEPRQATAALALALVEPA